MLVSFNGTARKVRLTDGRWPYLLEGVLTSRIPPGGTMAWLNRRQRRPAFKTALANSLIGASSSFISGAGSEIIPNVRFGSN